MKKQEDKIHVMVSAEMIIFLLKFAKKISSEGGLDKELAAAMIYASMSEFIISSLIQLIETHINHSLETSGSLVVHMQPKASSMPRDNIARLKLYSFPNDKKIFTLIGSIKKDRDSLFHDLIDAYDKGIDVDKVCKSIHKNGQELIELWTKTNSILGKPKFL
jgi:hypothetical protein